MPPQQLRLEWTVVIRCRMCWDSPLQRGSPFEQGRHPICWGHLQFDLQSFPRGGPGPSLQKLHSQCDTFCRHSPRNIVQRHCVSIRAGSRVFCVFSCAEHCCFGSSLMALRAFSSGWSLLAEVAFSMCHLLQTFATQHRPAPLCVHTSRKQCVLCIWLR
jgi:hypothetical protein